MIDRSLAWAYGNDLISDDFKEPVTMASIFIFDFIAVRDISLKKITFIKNHSLKISHSDYCERDNYITNHSLYMFFKLSFTLVSLLDKICVTYCGILNYCHFEISFV